MITKIEPTKLADGFELRFSLSPGDTFHEPGTKRIKLKSLYLLGHMTDFEAPQGYEEDVEFKRQFWDRKQPYKTLVHVRHYDDDVEEIPIQLEKDQVLLDYVYYADQCEALGKQGKIGTPEEDGAISLTLEDQSCQYIYDESLR